MRSRAKPTFKIATINISNMNVKEEDVVEVLKARDFSILVLCERRIKGNGERVLHGDYKIVFSRRGDIRHGVGVVVAPEIALYVVEVQHVSERKVVISVWSRYRKFNLMQIYASQ